MRFDLGVDPWGTIPRLAAQPLLQRVQFGWGCAALRCVAEQALQAV